MPQCFPFNIQLSIGTAISGIPYQLLITFGTSFFFCTVYFFFTFFFCDDPFTFRFPDIFIGHSHQQQQQRTDIALFAAVAGLVTDGEFDHCKNIVLGCVSRIPVFAIALFSVHSFICLGLLISKLRSEYELIVFTTESKERRKYAIAKEILSGYGFHFCVLFLLKTICVLYALLPDTSYAVKSVPLYFLVIFLTFTFLSNVFGSSDTFATNDPIFVSFTMIPGLIFLCLSLIEIPMILLKLDDHFNARWALIFIPYWVGLIVTVCGSCIAWSLSVIDLARHAYSTQSAEAETGKAFNRALLCLLIGVSATSFLALVSQSEDSSTKYSNFRISSPVWGSWFVWLAVYLVDHLFDTIYRTKNCYGDMLARKRQHKKELDEAEAHKISSTQNTRATEMPSPSSTNTATRQTKDIESQEEENAVLQIEADREIKTRIHELELSEGEYRILRHLTDILNIVQEYNVASVENRELLIKAARVVREAKESDWTRDVAQMFGKLLREFTRIGTIIKTKSSSMRSIRSLRETDVPDPPALHQIAP